jgi:prepilin-type N-terminal cleavage/methylation domain-containing protein
MPGTAIATLTPKEGPLKPGPGSPGFTLLEVLVAVAIVGLGLALVFRFMILQGQNQKIASQRILLLQEAQNIMTYWLAQPWIKPGHITGQSDKGVIWEVKISQVGGVVPDLKDRTRKNDRNRPIPVLFHLEVCCHYGRSPQGRPVCLHSERLFFSQG